MSGGGAHAQPVFQPVIENVLPADEIVTVRSRIPGSVAIGTCSPSYTRCSYTSSVTARRSCSTHSAAIADSSSRVNTLPVGLCGELSSTNSCLRRDRGAQLLERERVVGRAQGDDAPLRARERDARGVRVVVRLERHRLVARLEQREQGRRDRFGGAGGDEDLGVRVVLETPEPRLVLGHRLPQRRDADAGWVLVVAGPDGRDRGLHHLGRPVGVGEPLAEVDRPGADGEGRHLGEDRRAETPHPFHEVGHPFDEERVFGAHVTPRGERAAGRARRRRRRSPVA